MKSSKSKGIKGRFASHTRMQPAFLSQILANKYSLSLEQADLANTFLNHSEEESDFFILIVSRDRAGSNSLKKHYTKQIDLVRKGRLGIVKRFGKKPEIPDVLQGIFYSSWMYTAVHCALGIPRLRKLTELKVYFGFSEETLKQITDFLVENNLAYRQGEELFSNQDWTRLDRTSPLIDNFHASWRIKAIQSFENKKDEDLRYSGVFSMDHKTALKIREDLMEFISQQVKKIEITAGKDLFVLTADFFNLSK